MAKTENSPKSHPVGGLSILSLGLIAAGFFVFYIAGQAFTPDDAHFLHWGAAAVGGVAGWLIGIIIEQVRA